MCNVDQKTVHSPQCTHIIQLNYKSKIYYSISKIESKMQSAAVQRAECRLNHLFGH